MEKLALKVLSNCLRIDRCHVLSKIVKWIYLIVWDVPVFVGFFLFFFLLVKTVLNCQDSFCHFVPEQKCSHDFSILAHMFRKLVVALSSSKLVDLFPWWWKMLFLYYKALWAATTGSSNLNCCSNFCIEYSTLWGKLELLHLL